MRDIKFLLQRDVCAPGFTLGRLFVEGMMYGFTCEDQDRKLEEEPGAKILKRTAIPRGLYRLTLSFSNRFKKVMPLIKDVPGFDGVRIHGGNYAGNETFFVRVSKPAGYSELDFVEYLEVTR